MGLRFRAASSVLRIGRRLIANDVKPGRRSAPCRPDFEVLERRLTPSTYVWTAKGDGLTWNDPNNWQHLSPMTFTQVTGTPTPNSVIVFPSFSSLPKGSSKTIDFDFSYVNFPISTLVVADSYTFEGTAVTITDLVTIPSSLTTSGEPPDVTFLLNGLTLAPGVQVDTASGSTLDLASASDPTGLELDIQGPVTKTGLGQLVIDTQDVTFPGPVSVQQVPVSILGGTITLGASAVFTGVSFQINQGAGLIVADDVQASVGPLFGNGLVDLLGTTASGDTTSLTVYVPLPAVDSFGGLFEGIGQLGLTGYGTLQTGNIDFSDAGSIVVSTGTLDVNGSISAGTLEVNANSSFGGLGSWYFAGAVVFETGSTFDVTLSGTSAGGQHTQLVGASMASGVNLGLSTLAGNVTYQYQAGDQFTIVSAPLITGTFQNVVNGSVLLGGSVPFQVTATSTSVTLTALQSVTSTQLTSATNPSFPGAPVTFTATVTTRTAPVTTGTVSFEQGTTVLATVAVDSAGQASFTTSGLPVGSSTITAVYSGGAGNLGSTSPSLTQTVVPFSTVTSVTGAPDPSHIGEPVTLTATVLAQGMPVAAGAVSFYRGNHFLGAVPLGGGGTASLTLSSLPVGKVRVQAVYGGSTNYLSSVSPIFTVSVLPAPTSTSLVLSTQKMPGGATRYVLVATVTAEGTSGLVPTGTVVFSRNGKVVGKAKLQNGTALLVLGRTVPPHAMFVASFQGSARFGPSLSPALLTAG